jgi:hypothetical protein
VLLIQMHDKGCFDHGNLLKERVRWLKKNADMDVDLKIGDVTWININWWYFFCLFGSPYSGCL